MQPPYQFPVAPRAPFDSRNVGEAGFGDQPTQRTFTKESVFSAGSMPQQLPDTLQIQLDPDLKYHLVYVYTEAVLSVDGVDFVLRGKVKLFKGGRVVGDFPATIALDDANTLLKESVVMSFVNGISAKYSIKAVFQTKFTDGAGSALMTPRYVIAKADLLTWSLEGHKAVGATVDGYRTFIHVVSSNQPFP